MSFFSSTFGKANGSSTIKPSTNIIRKEVRAVPQVPKQTISQTNERHYQGQQSLSSPQQRHVNRLSPESSRSNSQLRKKHPTPSSSSSLKARSKAATTLSASSSVSPPSKRSSKSRPATIRTESRTATNKRKSESPGYGATFGSDSEGDNEVDFDSYTSTSRKRMRLGPGGAGHNGVNGKGAGANGAQWNARGIKRQIRDTESWTSTRDEAFQFEQSASLTAAAAAAGSASAYTLAFSGSTDGLSPAGAATLAGASERRASPSPAVTPTAAASLARTATPVAAATPPSSSTTTPSKPKGRQNADCAAELELEYPNGAQPERFQLVIPRASDAYRPLDDLYKTILTVLKYYLPESARQAHLKDVTGIPARLERALRTHSQPAFLAAAAEYNALVKAARHDGSMSAHLDTSMQHNEHPYLEEEIVERILEQIYERTVSPRVDSLRRYAMGSDNVYGEIKPNFASQIFQDTQLTPSSVFLDLGSGVGNVVLQAALQVGCEAHGIEMMDNPCELAAAQAAEFPARCRMWAIKPGSVSLRQGDFLDDAETAALVRRADVILVNNKAFTAETDTRLTHLFLEAKEGVRIVSLKNFVSVKLSERNAGSIVGMLDVQKKEFWTDYVSWTHEGGEYFVATKDSSRLRQLGL